MQRSSTALACGIGLRARKVGDIVTTAAAYAAMITQPTALAF